MERTLPHLEKGILRTSLRFDSDGRCISYGSIFEKLTPTLKRGSMIHDNFSLIVPENLETITAGTIHSMVLEIKKSSLRLKGECQILEDHSIFAIFFPEIQSVSDLIDLGINIGDFPSYLPIQQLAFIRETMEMGLAESHHLIEQLQETKRTLSYQKKQLNLALLTANLIVFEIDLDSEKITFYSPDGLLDKYGIFDGEKISLIDFNNIMKSDFRKQADKCYKQLKDKTINSGSFELQLTSHETTQDWWQINFMSENNDPIVPGILANIHARKNKEDAMARAEELNRKRFSLQVHDKLCQKLVAARMVMDIPIIEESKVLLDELIYDSRAIINVMGISFIEEVNSEQAFKKYVDNISRMQDGDLEFLWNGESDIVPFSLAFTLFGIFQEIIYYAIGKESSGVIISIENNANFRMVISGDLGEGDELCKLNQLELELRLPERKSSLKVHVKSSDETAVEFCVW